MKTFLTSVLASAILALASTANAQTPEKPAATSAEADKAWEDLNKAANTPPVPPEEWREKRPSDEEVQKFRTQQKEMTGSIADKAKDFYTRFPNHPKAAEAREKEREFLGLAVQLGDTNRVTRLESLEQEQLKDPNLSEDEKFEIRAQGVMRAAQKKQSEGMEAVVAEFEKGARALLKEFPKRGEVYQMLLMVASNSEGERARKLANEIVESDSAPDQIKEAAKGILKKMDALGKPVAIKFKAIDGREVDLAKMKGKVVLVDFWATWCGPCVAELPNVKAAYEKLHPKGFEIVGISFDHEKETLEKFVAEEKMPWPQYFDGEGWQNKFGQEFGITSIPAMWLVDKKGILRDMNARADLEQKVEKLLAE